MKILFISSLYYPHVGGIETVIYELCRRYKDAGHDVCILTKKYPLDLEDYSCIDGVGVYRVKSAKTIEDFTEVANRLCCIDETIKADCVHLIGLRRPMGIFALLLARKWGVPLVVSAGGGELPEAHDSLSQSIWNESKEIAINVSLQADKHITFSQDLKELIYEYISNDIDVDIIHAGVDVDKIKGIDPINYDKPFIFSCRRLVWSKGVDLTMHAFAIICNDFPDIDLVIAGDGDERESLHRLAKEYGISDRVKFIGMVTWKDSIRWLKSALFTVVPSRSEGGGLVNIEAQASGCPVIGSRAAGISEYTVENETALLFDVGDVGMLASHMKRLLSDSILRLSLSSRSIEYANNFSWDVISKEYLMAYDCLVENYHSKETILWSEESAAVWGIINKSMSMQELREKIENTYGFKVESIEHVRSSDDNDTYRAITDKGLFFVRVSKREGKSIVETNFELQFLHFLKLKTCFVSGIVSNKNDELSIILKNNRVVTVFEWIEGASANVSPGNYLATEKVYNAGKALASIHNASRGYDFEVKPKRSLTSELERILDVRQSILERYVNGAEFLETVSRLIGFARDYEGQKSILIHNDFRPHNVLFGLDGKENDIQAVVDFDWVCEAPSIKDLALALVEWSFADGDTHANAASLRAFYLGYSDTIDGGNKSILQDLENWIEFACLSDVATYVADVIMEDEKKGIMFKDQPKELRSYMLSKARYFKSIDVEKLLSD